MSNVVDGTAAPIVATVEIGDKVVALFSVDSAITNIDFVECRVLTLINYLVQGR